MKRTLVRWFSVVLAMVLCLGVLSPLTVLAEEAVVATEGDTWTYAEFVANLKVLEVYAADYAAANSGADANTLIINYIRTGVNKYTTDTWMTVAGAEITGFTTYVAEQDAAKSTTASSLRNLHQYTTPNGQSVDFQHMFGAMNIAYVNSRSADMGSWAGDLCDLIVFSKNGGVSGDLDTMITEIRSNYLGLDLDDVSGFGTEDIYGDLDSYYLIAQLKSGSKLSSTMQNYFTATLTDSDRAAYFLNNRFSGLETKEDVRAAIYDTYCADVAIKVLEADEGITSADATIRQACCYAFADYLFDLAGDRLEGGSDDDGDEDESSFYTVFSQKNSTLAPGISQSVNYAITKEDKQLAFYTVTVDMNRGDVGIQANYKDHDPSNGWGMSRVPDQMAAAQAVHSDPDSDLYINNFNVIAGVNADFYNMSTGKPAGALVMDGTVYQGANNKCFFAILNDGSAVIAAGSEWASYSANVREAVSGSEILVKNSTNCASSDAGKAPRTAVGITAYGQVIMIVIDGRQEPFSAGATMSEVADIMIDLGCVTALNLDGGGSSTFASKAEGSDSVSVVNSPSDGYVRSVSSSLLIYSTAETSTEFSYALVSADYSYLTVGTELEMRATGVSLSGNAATVPEGTTWQVSDTSIGSISESGVFTALANGDVDVQLLLDGNVVGSTTLHVVIPNGIAFEKETISAVYAVPTYLPLKASYNGNPVAFNLAELYMEYSVPEAGTIEGLYFTGIEESGVRTLLVAAVLLSNPEIMALATINLYKDGEAIFDFDNATAGNRTLAWTREVTNSVTDDEVVYQAEDPSEPMEISYVFALDLEQIEIPEQLKDLTYMLPGADAGSTAWQFLLQLAERVSPMTEVRVVAEFDKDLDVDLSNLTFVNEYFYLKSAEIDETTNIATIIVGWYDQTQALDPATANPICILSGIKATPKEGAAWDGNNQLAICNIGNVSYQIYMRASALYNFVQDADNQAQYGLYPYTNPDDPTDRGGSFGSEYATFEDNFTLDRTNREGWMASGKDLYYYVDNVPLTGVQKLEGYHDPDNEYLYIFDENGLCTGLATGLVELNGALYYAIGGEVKTGWRSVLNAEGETEYYFFDYTTGAAVDGVKTINGLTYTFTNYVLTKGQIVKTEEGIRYYWAGTHVIGKWIEVDGNTYYATYPKGYFAVGMVYARSPQEDGSYRYVFDENGVFLGDLNGMYDYEDNTYLIEDGCMIAEPGLVLIDGYYYYFASNGAAVKSRYYWITKHNDLLPQGMYYFDAEGKMVNPPVVEPDQPEDPDTPSTPKDGIVEENGKLYYYQDGVLQYGAGLILLDGDYYYVRSNGQLAVGKYWVTQNNNLLPQGMYEFGTDGKMLNPPTQDVEPSEPETTEPEATEPETTEPEAEPVKNGIIEENGVLYYYVNGTRGYGLGLILLDGDYYYVRSNGQLAIGKYWVTQHNDLLPQGMYEFGTDGKMLNPPTQDVEPSEPETTEPEAEPVKNGIIEENGVLYYYVNGTRGYGLGLILLDGDYYYVRSNGQLAIGSYWVTQNNDLLPQGLYTFGTDGKMIR